MKETTWAATEKKRLAKFTLQQANREVFVKVITEKKILLVVGTTLGHKG